MTTRRQVQWTGTEAIDALLTRANGRRTARRLVAADVERCVQRALESELGFAWVHGGDAPDARSVTSVCLAVVTPTGVTVGVGAAHGAATPAGAWADIATWDRYQDSANLAACLAWAGRAREDRVRLALRETRPTSTASGEDLRAAVLADPADDAPRLVLADWLTERGDPRGEFISVQCELARGPSEVAALELRERELIERHGAEWIGPGAEFLSVQFRRGFVESVGVLDVGALPQLESFFRREPVTELTFTSPRLIDGARFAALEWLERLRSLEFRTRRPNAPGALSREQFAHLLDSRRLRGLRRLVLVGERLGDEGLRLLTERGATTLPALEVLRFENDELSDRAVRAHVEVKWSSRLSELSFFGNELRIAGVEALAFARRPGQLARLDLGGNTIGNAGATIIASAPRFASLEHLALANANIGPAGVEALLGAESLAGLRSLALSGNPLGAAVMARVHARFPVPVHPERSRGASE